MKKAYVKAIAEILEAIDLEVDQFDNEQVVKKYTARIRAILLTS